MGALEGITLRRESASYGEKDSQDSQEGLNRWKALGTKPVKLIISKLNI